MQLDGGAPNGPSPPAVCLNNVWAVGWKPTNCSKAQLNGMLGFGLDMRSNITAGLHPHKDSAFVPSCVIHCQTILSVPWTTWALEGVRLQDHFYQWLVNGSAAAPPLIDSREYSPNNGPCTHT